MLTQAASFSSRAVDVVLASGANPGTLNRKHENALFRLIRRNDVASMRRVFDEFSKREEKEPYPYIAVVNNNKGVSLLNFATQLDNEVAFGLVLEELIKITREEVELVRDSLRSIPKYATSSNEKLAELVNTLIKILPGESANPYKDPEYNKQFLNVKLPGISELPEKDAQAIIKVFSRARFFINEVVENRVIHALQQVELDDPNNRKFHRLVRAAVKNETSEWWDKIKSYTADTWRSKVTVSKDRSQRALAS